MSCFLREIIAADEVIPSLELQLMLPHVAAFLDRMGRREASIQFQFGRMH